MKRLLSLFVSMPTMATLMLIFAVAIGAATFIENDFGTMTAKAEVYNAKWFEALMGLLAVNLMYNIFRFKMYQRKKALVLLFHVSFLVILLGAAVTRYSGYEGTMHIREGETVNHITSSDTYVSVGVRDGQQNLQYDFPILLSKLSKPTLNATLDANGKRLAVQLVEYLPNATYALVDDPAGKPIANLMVTTEQSRPDQVQLALGEYYTMPDMVIDFESGRTFNKPVIALYLDGDKLMMRHPMELSSMKMDDRSQAQLPAQQSDIFETRTLYSTGDASFVLRQFYPHAIKKLVSNDNATTAMSVGSPDALIVKVAMGDESKELVVFGSPGVVGTKSFATLDGTYVSVSYGAKSITLPFALKLVDFDLDRYPGSMSPSSYASDVILIDKEEGIEEPYRIYMNNVLDHRNYRFFQASYDQDELGTVLSVNNDPGTIITYIGYLMLTIGMFGSLFVAGGRYRRLMKKAHDAAVTKETLAALAMLVMVLITPRVEAEEINPLIKTVLSVNKASADEFGALSVQDSAGRMKPMDTLSTEIVNKINRSNSILGLNPNQIVLGMMVKPDAWREIKMIRTSDKEINKIIGIPEEEKFASFTQFFAYPDEIAGYKLGQYAGEAIRKAPKDRDKFDKAVLKVDERVNIAYMVYTGELLKIWPKPADPNHTWYATMEALETFPPNEAIVVRDLIVNYITSVENAISSGDWKEADAALAGIAAYQEQYGATVMLSPTQRDVEIIYNHANIFERLWPLYFIVGFVLLILSFLKILKPSFKLSFFTKLTFSLLVIFFIIHTIGLAMRWYISGHAPWSDGYESMIYIAWATVLAGFIFSKNSPITLAATGILTGLILFVAHLNWMDPQVTNLVPVLKSYWLSIHVSMITASYGFLGLGALLGFIVLLLFILKSSSNEQRISLSIIELNAINEMSLMIGLAMLTVGNFLGGVWANESWGRYWGWDPKETWALVTILVYAVVIHLRFMKKVYTPFGFAVVSLLSFTSVLMTYFGVNYYLAGMHSYAKGDPVPIPDFVPVTYTIIAIIIFLAYRKRHLAKDIS